MSIALTMESDGVFAKITPGGVLWLSSRLLVKSTGEELWRRMERAVEKVNERLRNTVRILENAKFPMRSSAVMPCELGLLRWMNLHYEQRAMSTYLLDDPEG